MAGSADVSVRHAVQPALNRGLGQPASVVRSTCKFWHLVNIASSRHDRRARRHEDVDDRYRRNMASGQICRPVKFAMTRRRTVAFVLPASVAITGLRPQPDRRYRRTFAMKPSLAVQCRVRNRTCRVALRHCGRPRGGAQTCHHHDINARNHLEVRPLPRGRYPDQLSLPLIDVVHSHSITRLSLTGPRASFLRTSSG